MNNLDYKFGFHDNIKSSFVSKRGLSEDIIREISGLKKEPKWMLDIRLNAFKIFNFKKMPDWGADLSGLNFDDIFYYVKPTDKKQSTWDKVPRDIKNTFEKIGIPEAERKFLAGVGAQYDSEAVYHSISKMLEKKGVIFLDTDTALQKYPEVFKEYFGKIIPPGDNKFAALNTTVWSGGSFVYIPKGVKVDLPLQAYFRINAQKLGQFERTLIIADEGSYVHYTEGCTAPIYTTTSLHCGVVEVFVKKGAHVRYSTVQNWSKNVYNLVTKRMFVESDGVGEWIDANLGSKATMKYPSIYLKGKGARGEILSLSLSGEGQNQDSGGKVIHLSSDTNSVINSKSIGKNNSKTTFRGLVKIAKNAKNCKSKMACHTLLLDDKSESSSFPVVVVQNNSSKVTHEAVVSSIEENQLFYLRTRGISKGKAENLIIKGFAEPVVKELPLEYGVELNRLIQMEMEQ